jgi:hypothetical protein
MHPPFGFALFYLRSVAPRSSYVDKITARRVAPVTTGEIYWGAVPFVIIQVIMIGVVIAFPQLVMHYKGKVVDPSTVTITVPSLPTLGAGGPRLGAPLMPGAPAPAPGATAPAPGGLAPPVFPGQAAPATPDPAAPAPAPAAPAPGGLAPPVIPAPATPGN